MKIILIFALFILPVIGAEPSPKALKYHKILHKRPSSGYVFDRFYDAWLDTASSAELEKFLTQKAANGNANDQLLLAYYYLRQGKEVKALKLYQTALKTSPKNAAIRLQKAKLEARLLNFEGALKDLQAALPHATEEQKLDIQKLQGQYLARSGQPAKAAKLWKSLLVAEPNNADLISSILEVQLSEGLFDEALATSELQIKITRDPYQKVIHTLRRGDIYQRAGKRKKAIETYVSALDSVGQSSWLEREILAQLREIYRREDDMEGLNNLYTDLITKHPQRVGIQKAQAHLLASLGRNDDAVALFRNVLKITPGNRKNREELISILLKTGKVKDALKEIRELAKAHPEDANIQLKLAAVLFRAKDTQAIPAALHRYQALNNNSEVSRLRVASLFIKYKLPAEAEKTLRASVKAFPESMESLGALATLLNTQDKKEEAISIWKNMIAKGNRATVIRQTTQLKQSGKDKLAYELLQSRLKDFRTDLTFLNHLTRVAIEQKDFSHASKWAMSILKLSHHSEEIRQAVKLNAQIALQSESEVALTQSLAKKTDRSSVQSWLLAELYELQGQSAQAVKTLKALRQQDKYLAAIAEVDLYEYRGDWKHAAEATLRLIALPKGKKPINLRRLVDFYDRLDQPKEALKYLEIWKQIAPGDKSPWFKQADLLTSLGRLDEAIQSLRRAAQRFDDDNAFRSKLAALYQSNEQYAHAERLYWRLYEEAKSLNERLRWIPRLAEVAEAQGRSADLIARFLEKRKNNRKSVEPLLALAEIYRFNESYEERRKFMMEAARLRPNDPDILFAIARIEEREGDVDRAETTLLQAAEVDKSDKTKRALAQFYLRNDEVEKGIHLIKELAGGNHANPRDLEKAAITIASSGDREAAITFVKNALSANPDDYRLAFLHAVLLSHEKRYSDSLTQLLATLKMNKPLQGVSPIKTQKQWKQEFQQAGGLLPKSQMYLLYDYYASKIFKQPSSNRMRRGPRGMTTPFPLPGDLYEKQPLVQGAIMYVLGQMDEQERSRVLPMVTAAGIEDIEYRTVLSKAMENMNQGGIKKLKDYAMAHPTRTEVFYIPVMMECMQFMMGRLYGFGGDQKVDTEFLTFTRDKTKGLSPSVLFNIEMTLLTSQEGKPSPDAWKRALALAAKIEKKEDIASSSTFLATAMEKTKGLPADLQTSILKQATQWYWSTSADANQLRNAFTSFLLGRMILSQASQQKDSATALSFLQKVCEAHAQQKNPTGTIPMSSIVFYGGGNRKKEFELPVFPPKETSAVPHLVASLFTKKEDQPRRGLGTPSLGEVDLQGLALDKLLDDVKDPYLRIYIAHYYDNKEVLESSLKTITSTEQPTLQATYYMAGYLTQQDKFAEASALLAKTRFLPMKRAQRKQLDEYLTALALAIISEDGEKKYPEAILQGRRAALRLRRSVTGNERRLLIAALDDLGLQKEADLVAAKATPSSSSRLFPSSSNNRSELKKIEKAIESGNKEKAQRLVLRSIKQQLHQQQGWSAVENAKRIRELVKKHHLLGYVKKKMHPGGSTSPRRQANYGLLLHLFGEDKEALTILDKAAKKGLKDTDVFLTLAFLLPSDRRDDAVTYLDKYIKNSSSQPFNNPLDNKFDELENSGVKDWLKGYDLLAYYLETRPVGQKKNKQSLAWVMQVASDLVTSNYVNGTSFPGLGSSEHLEEIKNDSQGYVKKRLSIARRLLKASLRQPELAAWAFPLYHASFISLKEEDKLDLNLAMTALKSSITGAAQQKNGQSGMGSMIMSSNDEQAEGKTPLNFIATQAWKKKNHTIFTKDYLDELRKIDKDSVHSLEVLQSILFLPEAQLESHISKALNQQTSKDARQLTAHMLAEVCLIRKHISPSMESWMTRKIPLDNLPNWKKHLQALNSTVPGYMALLIKKNPKRIAPLMMEITRAIIQPKGDISEFVKKTTPNSYTVDPSDPSFRVRAAKDLLQKMGRKKSLIMTIHAMRCMLSTGLADDADELSMMTYRLRNLRFKSLDEALTFFKAVDFGEMKTPGELVSFGKNKEDLNLFVQLVTSLSKSIYYDLSGYVSFKEIEKRLPTLDTDQQFILRLAVILQTNFDVDRKKYLDAILTTHKHPITDWDETMANWFTEKIIKPTLQNQTTKAISIPKNYSKDARTQLNHFLKSLKESVGKKLDAIIAFKEFKDDAQAKNTRKFLIEHFKTFLAEDRAKLVKALGNTANLTRAYQIKENKNQPYQNPFLNSYFSDDYSDFYQSILREYPHKKPGERLSFLHAVYHAEPRKSPSIPLAAIAETSKETQYFHEDITRKGREIGVYTKGLSKLIADYESLPKAQHPLAALNLVYFFCNDSDFTVGLHQQILKYVEDLNQKNPSIIKTAVCAGISANPLNWKSKAWGVRSAAHVRKLYKALPEPSQRILLTHILDLEGGEVFCDDEIQALATQAISEKLTDMTLQERFRAYRSLHNITFQKASTKNQKIYLALFNQLKADLRKSALSARGYSSSSSRDKEFSEKTNFSKPEQALLGLALRSGDAEALRHVMLRHKAKLIGNPYAVCLALRYNRPDIAHLLWKREKYKVDTYNASYTFPSALNAPIGLMDNRLEKSIPAFIKLDPKDIDRLMLRDTYLIQSSSFAPGFAPSQDFITRCESLVKKTLPTAKYGVDRVAEFYTILLANKRLDPENEKKMEALLMEISPKYMKELLKKKSYNLGRNWNSDHFHIISLYFYKLLIEDKLEEFTRVYNKIISAERANPGGERTVEPLSRIWLYLQPKIFDAINAGDKEKLLHYRQYLEPIASAVITFSDYGTNYKYSLPVALHALCYAFSDNPAEYQVFANKQRKISNEMKRRYLLTGFFPYDPLRHATYKGKPFSDKANEDFQFKVMKQVILAARAGMFSTQYVDNPRNTPHYKFLADQKTITQSVFRKLNEFVEYSQTVIGHWSPDLIGSTAKKPKDLIIDITKHITGNGRYIIKFSYQKGNDRLDIDYAEILRNNTESLGKDQHHGFTGLAQHKNSYFINITDFKPGQKYQLKARVYGDRSNNSHGKITLINPNGFDKVSLSVIGHWSPKVIGSTSKKPKDLTVDVTKHITGNGRYIIRFIYQKGNDRLDIDYVELLRNNTESLDKDKHHGWTGFSNSKNAYQINITDFKPGQKYQLKARVYGDRSNNSYGEIILINPN